MELKPGYKQTEVGLIPGDWKLSTIGTHTNWMSGGTPSRSNNEFWNGSIPWISGSTLKSFAISTSDQFLSENGVTAGSKIAPLGAVLLLVRGSALHNEIRAGMVVSPVAFNQDVKALIPLSGLDSRYLTFFILAMESDLLKLVSSAGNSAGVLDTELIKNFKLFLPAKAEQTAIANALSDADTLIQSLTRLIAKKRQIKQGAMQTLLNPYENGRLKADWVVKKLGELCNPSSVRINPRIERKIYKCIELEHIDQGSGRLLGHVSSNNQLSQKTLFKKGDVLFGKLRPYLKKYLFAEFDGVCSTEIWVLKSENSVSSLWLYYLVQSDQIVEAANQSTGTKMPRAE